MKRGDHIRIFQNYHRHSEYTNTRISDSVVTNADYAKKALELGHGIISTCEHGYQGRYIEGHELGNVCKNFNADNPECQKCSKFNYSCLRYQRTLAFVFGAEAYWVRDRFEKDRTNCHIYLGARNENGRQAINDILSEANLTGYYGQARLDPSLILSLPPKDVIVTTACVAFWQYDDVNDFVSQLNNHFKDNFFLEVQYHNTDKQRELNRRILQIHNDLKIPLIMGCDSHYIDAPQHQDRTDFLVSKGMNYPDEEGWYLDYVDGDTAYQRFANQCVLSDQEICDAMDNTNVFLEVERYDNPCFDTNIKLPSIYPDASQQEKDDKYQSLIWKWWDTYKHEIPQEQWSHYEDELSKEVATVVDTKMADYFLANHKIIERGKANGGWLTKTGRGSAVSFLTNKALGFTEVDRIASSVKMYPERFMSTTRILESGSIPDIDYNVAPVEPFARAQQEVLGEDHAYPMIAYGTMKTSAAWKLYAKSQGIPFEIANSVSAQIARYEKALKHAEEDEKDTIDVFDYIEPQYKNDFLKSKDYLGTIVSWSIAPCSYLLYQGSIRKEIGLVKIKDHICCLMDGHWAETYHFLKNDLLKVAVVDLIYRTFKRIGIEPFSTNELLKKCPPEDKAWDIYRRGCTLGINQCEQASTSVRVAKYHPQNISELCAFIAAIRPGFKSMYKIFEDRKPFKYNIKAFDELIQTEEMPNSFVLYQEMEMAALNYAGIPMSECYTAVKNIAKKRADKVLQYKEKFISGFSESIIRDENKTHEEAQRLSEQLWQIIQDSSRYSFNSSHSYSVALDSLYCSWLKAHYPVEFYESFLNLQSEKGDKDKLTAAKREAESFFKIKFPPLRFRQDNRSIIGITEENSITNSISSIKGFGSSVGDKLYEVGQNQHETFMEVLNDLDQHGIKASKVIPLIKIDYFAEFGNVKELLRILDVFEFFKQGTSKTVNKEKIADSPFKPIIEKYSNGLTSKGQNAKSYTIQDMTSILNECEAYIKSLHIADFDYKNKIQNQQEILGYIDLTTNNEDDRSTLLVTGVNALRSKDSPDPWAYAVFTRSIGSGKEGRFTVYRKIYDNDPIRASDIIKAKGIYKNKSGWWYLQDYQKQI